MMYPLALCSLAVYTIIIERLMVLRRRRIINPEIVTVMEQVRTTEDLPIVKAVCEKIRGPFANIIHSSLLHRDLASEDLRVTVEDEGRQQIRGLQRGLGALETIAAVAPLLGLLGTVLGMIEVFNVIEAIGVGQAKALSGGISVALITTATGLFVGIPSLIAYNYFNTRVESIVLDIEKHTLYFLTKVIRFKQNDTAPVELNLRTD